MWILAFHTDRGCLRPWVLALALGQAAAWAWGGQVAPDAEAVRRFAEVETTFANPGQGWMSQQRAPRGEPRLPCSVVYIRFDWADVEPESGRYDWRTIDDVMAAWKPRGATVAMRVMTANAHSRGYHSSPKWLFDAGCKGHEYLRGGDDPTSGGQRIPRIEPDYADPVYLERHGAFLAALGKRYDGHPDVEFLDIGSYGIWGEWHTPHPVPVEVRKRIVDLYRQAFPRTPLVFMTDDAEVLPHALALGAGLRRDGVGSPWHAENWIGSKKYAGVVAMADAWRNAPVVFEWFGNHAYLQSRGWSFGAAVDFMLSNHVTLINDNIGEVPPEEMPQLQRLARLAGARFVLRELAHRRAVPRGDQIELRMRWANTGVGRLHRPYRLRLALLNEGGRPVAETESAADPRTWLPGDHALVERIKVPAPLRPGPHALAVLLVDPANPSRPFRLAIDTPMRGAWHEVGQVTVE